MPELIYSQVVPDTLLHIVQRKCEITEERQDIVPATEGLQVACFELPEGKTFRPHEHIPRPREVPQTQETWIIIRGLICVTYYDLDGKKLTERFLAAGDCTVTLDGGHNYQSLESDTMVYEVKTGPFVGVAVDKRFLE